MRRSVMRWAAPVGVALALVGCTAPAEHRAAAAPEAYVGLSSDYRERDAWAGGHQAGNGTASADGAVPITMYMTTW